MAGANLPVGHFELPLIINADSEMVKKTTDFKDGRLKDFLVSKSQRPERHAIRNLLGAMAFRQGKVQDAKDYFKKILEPGEDPDNLNAKANLNYVERQTLSDEDYVTSGVGLAASHIGPHEVEEKKMLGRRYAEQAFAFMFENYHETLTCERYKKAMKLYDMAMAVAGNLVDSQEKDDWHLGFGEASRKILQVMAKQRRPRDEASKHFQTTVTHYWAVINSESADPDMKSDAYLHIGLALADAHLCKIFLDEEPLPPSLKSGIKDQETCFGKALRFEISDSSKASVYTRLAVLRNRKGHFEEAMGLLGDSIRLDGSKRNFHAYSVRANMRLKQFKKSRANGNADLLTPAKEDFEFALQEHVSPWDFRGLADVCLQLAKNSTGSQSDRYIEEALEMCSKSEACQDGKDSPELHQIRGQCLSFSGRHQEAAKSFQQGLECERKTHQKCDNARLLAEEQTHLL